MPLLLLVGTCGRFFVDFNQQLKLLKKLKLISNPISEEIRIYLLYIKGNRSLKQTGFLCLAILEKFRFKTFWE